ncbi:MAG: helix-turn-helix domain-containing protein [Bacteroidales bacterium]|nr:helix-turn-helix domain-containing protein [Bacteroidales bacterium]
MENQLSMGDQFLSKIHQCIEENLENENFSVENLAEHVGISRSMLHRKLVRLTGKSAGDLITEKRMKRARELLERDVATASEIAYKVGFNSPSYFNKVFKSYFQVSPGDIKKQAGTLTESPTYGRTPKTLLAFGIKNFKKRIILLFVTLLIAGFGIGVFYYAARNIPYNKSILILPFDNLSDKEENQYFADGITEDILNNLFLISDLRVVSRTTSKGFSNTKLTAKEIARKVHTRNVLEGSVRRYGNKARISVQLIDARRDEHLWSANFDREINDIIGIQGDIALQVAMKLNAVISEKEKTQIEKNPTINPEAYDNYLKGRFLLHKANSEQRSDFDRESVMNCIQYYEKAIAADSNFTEAYSGLANAQFNLSAWGWLPFQEGAYKAIQNSLKALEINPDCAEAHAVIGAFHVWGERKFEEGRQDFIKAVALNPNFATTRQWYAQLLMITGPIEEARMHMDRAVELEPYFWVVQNVNAWIYYFEKKYEKAIEACIIARNLKPNFSDNTWLFFLNYAKLGETDMAAKELQHIVNYHPGTSRYAKEIENVAKKSGIRGLFEWMVHANLNNPISVDGLNGHAFYIAWWNAIMGNKEESIHWLQKNLENENKLYLYFNLIATCPDFDILRSDPRFDTILDEAGLGAYNTSKAKTNRP